MVEEGVVLVQKCVIFEGDGKILLIRRSVQDRYGAGMWDLPGGKVSENEDKRQALLREVREETGLIVAVIHPFVHTLNEASVVYSGRIYRAEFSVGHLLGGSLRLSEEHDAFMWVNIDDTDGLDLKPELCSVLSTFQKYKPN